MVERGDFELAAKLAAGAGHSLEHLRIYLHEAAAKRP
jgi:hypothetical protein